MNPEWHIWQTRILQTIFNVNGINRLKAGINIKEMTKYDRKLQFLNFVFSTYRQLTDNLLEVINGGKL